MASPACSPRPLLAPLACPPSYLCCHLLSLFLLCLLPLNHSAPLSTRSLPQFLPPLSVVVVAVAPPALLSLFGTKLNARLVYCCLEGLHPCPALSTRSSLPPSRQLSMSLSWSAADCCFRPPSMPPLARSSPPLSAQQQPSSSLLLLRNDGTRGGGCAAIVVAAQRWQHSDDSAAMAAQRWQRRWRRSNGDGGAATAMAAQQRRRSNGDGGAEMATVAHQRLRKCSNGNGDGGAGMGVAVVVVAA